MRLTLKIISVVGTTLGGLVITAATVSPQDADSNVAAWLRVLGIENPPFALITSSTDHWAIALGLVILALGIFGVREWRRGDQNMQEEPIHDNLKERPSEPQQGSPGADGLNRFFSPTVTQQYDLMPLARAATEIYSEFRHAFEQAIPVPAWQDPDKVLGMCAHQVIGNDLIPVWGIFTPGTWVKKIPKEDAKTFQFSGDAAEMYDAGHDKRRYINVQIDKKDFERRRGEMRHQYRD